MQDHTPTCGEVHIGICNDLHLSKVAEIVVGLALNESPCGVGVRGCLSNGILVIHLQIEVVTTVSISAVKRKVNDLVPSVSVCGSSGGLIDICPEVGSLTGTNDNVGRSKVGLIDQGVHHVIAVGLGEG